MEVLSKRREEDHFLTVEVITKQEITKLLNDWYQEMRVHHVIKARKLKEEIDRKIDRIEGNRDILTYYSLLDFRYKILIEDFKADFHTPISEQQTNTFLKYYYHFFKFIYAMETGNYSDAKKYCKLAEELLVTIPDEAEKAEFHYRVAIFQYYLAQPVLAIHYATKAQEFFFQREGYEIKVGACKNLLGMACITLEQYELAEEYLLEALDVFKDTDESLLIVKVRHNLGLLYADQDLSEIAIRHLTEVLRENRRIKATYILARENFKLNRTQEASTYIEEGLKLDHEQYNYHFSILKAKNNCVPIEELEGIIGQAIEYFKKQELWKNVYLYTEELANKWYDVGNESKASTYFRISYEARKTLKKLGALK
jgi:tetratricopeptide (TPR) repeat protein